MTGMSVFRVHIRPGKWLQLLWSTIHSFCPSWTRFHCWIRKDTPWNGLKMVWLRCLSNVTVHTFLGFGRNILNWTSRRTCWWHRASGCRNLSLWSLTCGATPVFHSSQRVSTPTKGCVLSGSTLTKCAPSAVGRSRRTRWQCSRTRNTR